MCVGMCWVLGCVGCLDVCGFLGCVWGFGMFVGFWDVCVWCLDVSGFVCMGCCVVLLCILVERVNANMFSIGNNCARNQ